MDIELCGELEASGGLELCGGREQPAFPGDHAVYVASVAPGSVADGKLR